MPKSIARLLLENVRCFHSARKVTLAPITLLIGENSSGKSTLLSLLRIASDIGLRTPDFNEEPFLLGAFDQIAHYHGGRGGRARQFHLGYTIPVTAVASSLGSEIQVSAKFMEKDGQPIIETLSVESAGYLAEIIPEKKEVNFQAPSGSLPNRLDTNLSALLDFRDLGMLLVLGASARALSKLATESEREDLEIIARMLDYLFIDGAHRPYASAPIRTRPQRTYDPVKDIPGPEGSHVPMLLAKLQAGENKKWSRIQKSLSAFGESSGLFREVRVKKMGRKRSDPFQLQVRIGRPAFNLVDVGYGVSQVLPIMVDCLNSEKGQTFLLQQPEVHLHPRAQAELGTFFGLLAHEQDKQFIIETHSDYMIDRIRLDIRDKKHLRADQVAILYFERLPQNDVAIHQLQLDRRGNIVNAPIGYRRFFLEEEDRFMSA
jgi:hypothetical protein